jgi:chloramphenicol-sensitive protein RarD
MGEGRKGFVYGLAAYLLWGVFPLYFPLLEPAGAAEVLAHRILWSAVLMFAAVPILGRWRDVRRVLADPRLRLLLCCSSVLITLNWGTFIYAVNNGHVVESSLGYFINPLVSVLAGVLLLGERLRPLQWVAVGLASAAVVGLTIEYGRPPWIALVLAFSFAGYGLVRKKANVGTIEGLTVETGVMAPVALAYIVVLMATGGSHAGLHFPWHLLLLMTSGVVTAAPLLLYGAAVTRAPLSALGILFYVNPTIQFLVGVLVVGESMPPARLAGFAVIWLALAVFTIDSIRERRRTPALVAEQPEAQVHPGA